jgi:hypothetical protein
MFMTSQIQDCLIRIMYIPASGLRKELLVLHHTIFRIHYAISLAMGNHHTGLVT